MMTNIHVSIIVHKGDPLDWPEYRHTALWLRSDDGSPALIVHIIGASGTFEFQIRPDSHPDEDKLYVRTVDVGHLDGAMSAAQVVEALQRVGIDNRDREFNCQTWVERALKEFVVAGWLAGDVYEQGVDGMVEGISEALYQ